LIGFFWYSAYFPGVIVGGLLFGALGGFLEELLSGSARRDSVLVLCYVLTGFVWAYSIRMGIPYMVMNERLHWIVGVTLVLLLAAWRRSPIDTSDKN
jgi:hypothetical protein